MNLEYKMPGVPANDNEPSSLEIARDLAAEKKRLEIARKLGLGEDSTFEVIQVEIRRYYTDDEGKNEALADLGISKEEEELVNTIASGGTPSDELLGLERVVEVAGEEVVAAKKRELIDKLNAELRMEAGMELLREDSTWGEMWAAWQLHLAKKWGNADPEAKASTGFKDEDPGFIELMAEKEKRGEI